MIASKQQVAEIFGAAPSTIESWVRKGCPRISKGAPGRQAQYDTVEVYRWLIGGQELDLNQERAKLAVEQRKRIEMQNEEASGRLIDTAEVHKAWTKYVAACRAKLLAMPTKLAPVMLGVTSPTEAKDLIKKAVYEALDELAA